MQKKEFKIARILSEQQVVINGGKNDDIHIGQKFEILDTKANIVKDPVTHEILGSLGTAVKATVVAVKVQNKLTICKSDMTSMTQLEIDRHVQDTFDRAIRNMSAFTIATSKTNANLNVKKDQIDPIKKSEHSSNPIEIGDLVMKV